MARATFDELLDAGVHFGHLKRKWNPYMAPYIFSEKRGIHIIDLNKTVAQLDIACAALKQIAKSGKTAFIKLKINNLVDNEMIAKLYSASQAGVKIELIVRGICTLVPKEDKISENIKAISIVDRYLEHARFMIFGNDKNPLYFISSADWMERNLNSRIEVTAPILDDAIKKELDIIFKYQWNGNVKARTLDKWMKNRYRRKNAKQPFRAQFELYEHYKRFLQKTK